MSITPASPIFIVGAPRSGTTLLRAMLNRHPSIAICDETYYFYYVYTRRRAFGDLTDPERRRMLAERFLATERIRRLGLDVAGTRESLVEHGDSYASFFDTLLQCYASAQGKSRYGEKTPDHALFSEVLCSWYPECRLIHLVRDPRDVVSSLLRMPWAQGRVLGSARVWRDYALAADRCRERANYLLVHYSDLVTEPEPALHRICEFIGEPYAASMLETGDSARAEKWWFQRAAEPVSTNRLDVWRRELSPAQVALIEWQAGAAMTRFGYEQDGKRPSPGSMAAAWAEDLLARAWHKVVRLPRLWYYWVQPTRLAAEERWIDRGN